MKARLRNELKLINAATDNDIDSVRYAIKNNVNLEVKDGQSWTALQLACYKGHAGIAKLLIENGADIESREGNKATRYTPLMTALIYSHYDVFELLLKNGADVDAKGDNGYSPLLFLAARIPEQSHFLKALLKYKPSFDVKDKGGMTALEVAKEKGYVEFLSLTESFLEEMSLNQVIQDYSNDLHTFSF